MKVTKISARIEKKVTIKGANENWHSFGASLSASAELDTPQEQANWRVCQAALSQDLKSEVQKHLPGPGRKCIILTDKRSKNEP